MGGLAGKDRAAPPAAEVWYIRNKIIPARCVLSVSILVGAGMLIIPAIECRELFATNAGDAAPWAGSSWYGPQDHVWCHMLFLHCMPQRCQSTRTQA